MHSSTIQGKLACVAFLAKAMGEWPFSMEPLFSMWEEEESWSAAELLDLSVGEYSESVIPG